MSGRPIEEFTKMDRNGDGFLTVDEVLYAQRSDPRADNGINVASTTPTILGGNGMGGNGMGGFGNGNRNAFRGRGPGGAGNPRGNGGNGGNGGNRGRGPRNGFGNFGG